MKRKTLGNTGIEVSQLGLGSLTMGGLQKNLSQKEIERVVSKCIDCGIDFTDTAEIYDSYNVVREMVRQKHDVVVSSKSYAYDAVGAEKAFYGALKAIGRDYIDLFLMHEQESEYTIMGHHDALEFYLKMKQKGYVRAVGLSTHKVAGVLGANKFWQIDVVHPLFNYKGVGVFDGTQEDMENAVKRAHELGKGVYAMKIFGGGHLLSAREAAARYILEKPYIDSAMVGMQSVEEVIDDVALFENEGNAVLTAKIENKRVSIGDWCERCLKCVAACPQNALSFDGENVKVDESKCLLCGYCASACEAVCIKVY